MTRQISSFPLHVVSEIIHSFVTSVTFEEAQQLRLVNRLFYHEILFATYISLGQTKPRTQRQLTHQVSCVIARRALQGHLTRSPHDEWTANISGAITRLGALARSPDPVFKSPRSEFLRCHSSCGSSPPPLFNDPVSVLVCDALVAYYSPSEILQAIYEPEEGPQCASTRNHCATYWSSFLILLAACFLGDLVFLQQALNDQRFTKHTDYHTLVSSCLRLVGQQGHVDVMKYLLDAGFDINHIGTGYCAVFDEVARGDNQHLLRLLLSPEYSLKRSGHHYRIALFAVAKHPNTTTRLENVKNLYMAAEGLEQPRAREQLLFTACQVDDMAFARWVLADGPVDLYSHLGLVRLKSQSILHWLARAGKFEWVKWFLQLQPPQFADNLRHRLVLRAALSSAACLNHSETFWELAKFFEHEPERLCLEAANIEDGLPLLFACYPSVDLQSPLSQQFSIPRLFEATTGPAALRNAISNARSSNIHLLLERGVRTSESVLIRRSHYETNQTSFSAIQAMLINHGNPPFGIIKDPGGYRP